MRQEITGKKIPAPLPISARYGITVATAAQYVGISRSRLYELISDGLLEARIIGGRRIILVESLLRLCAESPSAKRDRENAA